MLIANPKVLKPGESYTFHDYFKMRFSVKSILADLGCEFIKQDLNLPMSPWDISNLQKRIAKYWPFVLLDSEDARKQILIGPLLLELVGELQTPMEIKFSIEINQYLKGALDYYLNADKKNVIVIEAKNADMSKGFTQMAIELIGLQHWLSTSEQEFSHPIYGAVTTGESWQFGKYENKTIYQDTNNYSVPNQLSDVAAILKDLLTQ